MIPPGASAPLTFHVDLRATQCRSAEPQAVREAKIRVALGPETSPAEKLTAVELHGRVKSAIAVSARQIDFGRFAVTAKPPARVVPIRPLVALQNLDVSVEGTSVLAELKVIAQGKWELQIQPVMPSAVGRHEAKVRLAPTTAGGEQVPPITIPVAFDVLHDIQPDTSLIPLGAGHVGETLRSTLTVSSLSGRPFPLPTCEGADVFVQPTSPALLQSCYTFNLELKKVTAIGNHVSAVVVRGRDADGRPFELRVGVQWYGLTP